MKNKLFQKIFVTTSVALMISILLINILLTVTYDNYFVREKKRLLIDSCQTVASVISSETDNNAYFYVSLNGVINTLSEAVMGEIYVSDCNGNVFICSCTDWKEEKSCIHANGSIPDEIIKDISNNGFFEVGNLTNKFNNIYYTAATPFYSTDGVLAGYVFISSSTETLRSMWSELVKLYVICCAIPLILLFVFLYVMTRKITKPINQISNAAVSMSHGDYSHRIPVEGNDEIANLAESFNAMSNSLTQLEGMRRSFIANVSHELRTPMTTIGGFIDGILDGTIPPEKQNHYLKIISIEITRLSRLVQSMLSLARLESGENKINLTEVKLNDLIIEIVLSQEQRIVEKNINIEGLDNDNNIIIKCDRDLIYQVIFNLIDNAIKFTSENGNISFVVEKDSKNKVHFKIRNDGVGINPEEMQYIFDRFYKSDRSRSINKEGTGLGLYLVKTIVDIHKGKIKVISMPNKFTEFEIIFN